MKGYFLPTTSIAEKKTQHHHLSIELPVLSADEVIDISDRLIRAGERLSKEPIFKIIDWIDTAAQRWLDPKDPIRKEAESLLPLASGVSKEMVRFILDDLFKNLTRPVLIHLLEEELGNPALCDGFRPKRKGVGFTRVIGPRLITHILPGNISGTAIVSLVCGLLAKSANLAKVSMDELLLPVLFARSLHQIRPELAESMAILTWDNNNTDITRAAFQRADLAIVYGSDETIAKVRENIPPATLTLFHGHRLSLGVIARESIRKEVADQAAIDIALYDQMGCLSPHLYYVESLGSHTPLEFAQWLSQALYAVSNRLPKGETPPDIAAHIQQLRGSLPLRGGKVFSSPKGVDWTVLYDPDPHFLSSPLSRTIWVKPVHDLTEIVSHLKPIRSILQAIGIAIPEKRQPELIPAIVKMGASRICAIGKMQMPPITWHHDGRFRLANFLRFVDWEQT
ncbi:MAG: acyl-CoA reductase [Nitrospira sp.]|nr:hypothetical protein [Candidatus Manganitrophaceae bacterium]HIL34914.1 hypothetical protein [Candidatus Manganitrophaceae bacterium]